jgi:outer membrane lipoprotein-sorting protein
MDCCVIDGPTSAPVGRSPVTADEVLAAMAERYAGCVTYRDSGKAITRFISDSGRSRSSIKPFTTAFIRPNRFRFEFRSRHGDAEEDWDPYIVFADGREVLTWWGVRPGIERPESLRDALAAATGVSSRSSHTVPSLLLPGEFEGSRLLTDLVEVRSLDDGVVDGQACFRLTGIFRPPTLDPEEEQERVDGPTDLTKDAPSIVWIDQETLLLKRLEDATEFDTFRTESVTTYAAEMNVSIDEEELRFDPPA